MIVKVCNVPEQPFAEGVTVMMATMGVVPELTATNAGMLPEPLAARPMLGWLFVQVNVVPEMVPAKFTAAVIAPLQTVWSAGSETVGVGLTVIVKVWEGPVQPFAEGETVIVATIIVVPVLVAVKAAMFPEPLAARPMLGWLFVQMNVVPETAPEKFTAAVVAPLQSVWSAGSATVGVGLTVMVKVCDVPVQPIAEGETVMVATIVEVPRLVAVKAGMLPEPLAARPMLGWLFVQLKFVPGTVPEKLTAAVVAPLQMVWSTGSATVGVGLTVIVNVWLAPAQPFAVGVTVMVATMGAAPELVAVKAGMFPEPLAARPMLG